MATSEFDRPLNESDLDPHPYAQFRVWLHEASQAGEPMPTAMALATSSVEGLPSVRMVQLDLIDARGFVFQTHLHSPKARDLTATRVAAANFHWPSLQRAVRLSGGVEPLTRHEVGGLFAELPSAVQAMLHACTQSQVIADRTMLEHSFAAALESEHSQVPRHWGGYRLVPDWVEFWQGRPNWLQDRLRYARRGTSWVVERLQP